MNLTDLSALYKFYKNNFTMFHPDQRSIDKNLMVIYSVKRYPLVYSSSSRKGQREIWEQIDKACRSDKMQARNRLRQLVNNFCTHMNVTKKTPLRNAHREEIKSISTRYFNEINQQRSRKIEKSIHSHNLKEDIYEA
ncbi:uncharacterized protein LOC129242967 [Anastrepha obliqua]|uniref:uncharacterized protein LOC129242967 n=1 Tax=Anastrepha obliqua TaxID=95512 RepID=UPI002409B3A3|nr:uncharacterized protein LOC129242967 [Anastrepha obliqua]